MSGRSVSAFTLSEVLVVIAIISVLAALLTPAINLVRESARKAEAVQTVSMLLVSLEAYASIDERKRFPYPGPFNPVSHAYGPAAATYLHYPEASDPELAYSLCRFDLKGATTINGIITLLESTGQPMPVMRFDHSDEDGRLMDPWGHPYRYRLQLNGATRNAFTCIHGKSGLRLTDWNWNAVADNEAKRNGQDPTLARPYPYIYSWGRSGTATDPCTWIYKADSR